MFYLPHTPPTPPQLIYFPFLILLFIFDIYPRPHRPVHRPYMDPTLTLPSTFVFPPPHFCCFPLPPPPHFYCFPSTTSTTAPTFLLLSFHHHHHQHHISIVFFHHYRHISIVLLPVCKVIWWWRSRENNRNVVVVVVVVVEGKQEKCGVGGRGKQ